MRALLSCFFLREVDLENVSRSVTLNLSGAC